MEDVEIATKIVSMEKDIEHIKEKIEMLDERMAGFIQAVEDQRKEDSNKYAAKWSEYVIKSMVAIILGTVLVALLARVIIK